MLENPSAVSPHPVSLIGPGDPPAFEVFNPGASVPILLVSDHASRVVPRAMNSLGLDAGALQRHIAYDIGAAELTRELARRLHAPAVLAGYSRLLIDCNRQPGHAQSVPEVSDATPIPGNRGLGAPAHAARVETFFSPYHAAIASQLARLGQAGEGGGPVPPALLSIHTFTPSLGGEDRYWDIGVLWNRDPRLARPLMEKLRAEGGLHVGDNEPDSGRHIAYTIDRHGGAAGLPNCAVDIRQDLVQDAAGVGRWAAMLHRALTHVLAVDDLHREKHF